MSIPVLTRVLRKLNHHRSTETYFVGYPKTGNTWLRFLLGRYMQLYCRLDYQPLFDSTDWLGRCERACVGPAIQFTHRPLTWERQTAADLSLANVIEPFAGKKVVLLIRHPLDALASQWQQQRFRVAPPFTGDFVEFLQHPVYGLDKCLRFHQLWHAECARSDAVHVLRYETMRQAPLETATEVLRFLAIPIDERLLELAVGDASFERMRELEAAGQGPRYRSSGLSIFATGDRGQPDAYHVRRGKVGGYRDYLDSAASARCEMRVHEGLSFWYP